MILHTWECRFPPTKDLYIVVSLAVVKLSDGRCEVCRFRPLLIANGSILARDEEMPEEMAKALVGRAGSSSGGRLTPELRDSLIPNSSGRKEGDKSN
jgi:hypothetical protein